MLANLYHLHHQKYLEDIPFWKKLATQFGGPILELGCGTGRVTIPLHHEGFNITGVDKDPDMLAILRRDIKDNKLINILQEDFTNLSLDKKYPLILMPCNTYSTLSNEGRKNVLSLLNDQLDTGGAFSFSVPNPAWMANLPAEAEPELEDIFSDPENGDVVQVSSAWKNDGERVTVYWHYDRLLADGLVNRTTNQTIHLLNSSAQYLDELEDFSTKIFGDFEGSPYTQESDYLIVVANKK